MRHIQKFISIEDLQRAIQKAQEKGLEKDVDFLVYTIPDRVMLEHTYYILPYPRGVKEDYNGKKATIIKHRAHIDLHESTKHLNVILNELKFDPNTIESRFIGDTLKITLTAPNACQALRV
jgi:hypothetical protein